ncbi:MULTISPECIES: RidA family protein [Polaromonas]|uniref:RidA family protein n=1 Tax=Polaromonas aquatica TaxID=332657 RepID=A0ABW1TYC2_9BURK
MTMLKHNPTTIAAPAGAYCNGVSAPGGGRWLHIAGQVGIAPDGSVSDDFDQQTKVAWSNLVAVLEHAGMSVADLVKVNHFLVRPGDMAAYAAIRAEYLGDARPASTVLIVQALARPQWLVEVDAVAWKA